MQRKTIVAIGFHDQQSPRHWNICEAFRKEGCNIIECHTTASGFFGKCADLWKKYCQLSGVSFQVSGVLVTFPGHYLAPLAWILTRFPRRKLIFDAFISLYDTNVSDRQRVSRWHPRAWLWYIVDLVSCHLADEVLIDTEEHKKYFVRVFKLNPKRVRVIYLEARTDLFFPQAHRSPLLPNRQAGTAHRSFEVLFYGSFIPLHGIDYILHAAAILQDRLPCVHFTLIGSGQQHTMFALARKLHLRTVTFLPSVPLHELPSHISSADLCLGIFGISAKVQRVIPHKVLDAVACGIPVITANTPAMRERFHGHPLVTLCRPGDPHSIAETILRHFSRHIPQCSARKKPAPSLIG